MMFTPQQLLKIHLKKYFLFLILPAVTDVHVMLNRIDMKKEFVQ